MEAKKEVETDIAILTFKDNVMFVAMKEGIELGAVNLKDLLKEAVTLANYEKYYVIIDNRNIYNTSPEARDYYSENEYTKYRYADAIIVNSLSMRLVANFFIKFNKPKIPTKLFDNEAKAYEWIQSLKVKQSL